MKKLLGMLLGICAAAGLAGQASAETRESVSFAGVNSDSFIPTTLSHDFGGGYPVKQIIFSATLTPLRGSTLPSEAIVYVTPPNGGAPFTLQPFVNGFVDGVATVSRLTYVLPTPLEPGHSIGTWNFRFNETFDDGSGADAFWESLVITLDDGVPPAAVNLGALSQFPLQVANQPLAAGEIKWYKIVVVDDVNIGPATFLDIDTEGSTVPTNNDTEIALYDDHGRLVAADDDDGSGNHSQLSFGIGTRSPVGDGASYNGRDGNIPGGVYYIAVSVFDTDFQTSGWVVTPPVSPRPANITLNIRTNTGIIDCTADFNRNGQLNSQDFFDFLSAFFTGCN